MILSLVALGAVCLRRDLLGSGEGIPFLRGGGVATSDELDSVAVTCEPVSFTLIFEGVFVIDAGLAIGVTSGAGEFVLLSDCLVFMILPTIESRLDTLPTDDDCDCEKREVELGISVRSLSSSSLSIVESPGGVGDIAESLLEFVVDIRLSGGGAATAVLGVSVPAI